MIRYFRKEQGQLIELDSFLSGCWVHISTPFSSNELEDFAEQFDIPLDYLTDSLDSEERARYEKEDNFRFILINTPIPNNREDEHQAVFLTVPIGILFSETFLITISAFDNTVIDLFLKDKVRHFNPSDFKLFILQILDQNVNRFTSYLKKLNLSRDVIEQQLISSSRSHELQQLLGLEKSSIYFVNALSSNELLKLKLKRTDFLGINNDEDKLDYFEDIIIDNNQAHQMANVFTHIISGTTDAMASMISNNLNIIIQRWTMITIVLMVPTLVSSFYGMNVKHLPLADSQYSFYYICVISLVLSLSLVWFFRRKELF
ncbi:MAG: magnesium transporter CorA family protein [Saprospiraceae bacterium]|jgi:magnesium transporter|nr:magnesium transporter CorA family protein [Saprospiraceae bacterium]